MQLLSSNALHVFFFICILLIFVSLFLLPWHLILITVIKSGPPPPRNKAVKNESRVPATGELLQRTVKFRFTVWRGSSH